MTALFPLCSGAKRTPLRTFSDDADVVQVLNFGYIRVAFSRGKLVFGSSTGEQSSSRIRGRPLTRVATNCTTPVLAAYPDKVRVPLLFFVTGDNFRLVAHETTLSGRGCQIFSVLVPLTWGISQRVQVQRGLDTRGIHIELSGRD